jgi:hypothetical protein
MRTLLIGRDNSITRYQYLRYVERISRFSPLSLSAFVKDEYAWAFNQRANWDDPEFPLTKLFDRKWAESAGATTVNGFLNLQ